MSKHHRKDNTCLNCGYTVDKIYCSNCGQENVEPKETFLELVADFYADVFHYDSKFFLSFKYLFSKPGELSLAYMQGKRSTYIHPFRLFFFLSVILVLILEIPFSHNTYAREEISKSRNKFAAKFYESLHVEALPATVDDLEAQQKAEGIVVGPLKHKLNVQLMKLKGRGEEFYLESHHESQLKVMPRFYIVMMPFIAIFLWFVFLGSRFNFVNHLIFSFHFVSFFIIIAAGYQLLARLASYLSPQVFAMFPGESTSFSVIFGIALVYLVFAVKHFYKLDWLATLVRSTTVFILIIGLFLVAFSLVACYTLFTI